MADPFPKAAARVPTSIGTIIVTLKDRLADGDQKASQAITYQFEVLDADGQRIHVMAGDLQAYLTVTQGTQLKALLTALRTKTTEAL